MKLYCLKEFLNFENQHKDSLALACLTQSQPASASESFSAATLLTFAMASVNETGA